MNKMFSNDGPVMAFLSKCADIIVLSALWFLCSIPIITIGPATAALYYVALKIVRKEEGLKVSKAFFHGFATNFKQGVVLNLIFLVAGVVVFLDYFIMSSVEGLWGTICSVCFFVMGIWLLCVMFYTYPLQAQFINPIRSTLKNAALLSSQNVVTTVIVFALHMIPLVIAMKAWKLFLMAIPVWMMVTPGLFAYISSMRFVKIFDPLILPAESKETVEVE
jgi:uncharacterized membrane protein YesL